MNNEELRQLMNVVKYHIQQAFEGAAEAEGREMEMPETLRMIELMGRLSNVQAVLEADVGAKHVLMAAGQCEAWDAVYANRGATAADAMFGARS